MSVSVAIPWIINCYKAKATQRGSKTGRVFLHRYGKGGGLDCETGPAEGSSHESGTNSFHVRHQRQLDVPRSCVIIPEAKISVHARLASETRCDTAFVKLVRSLAFPMSRWNFCIPPRDPLVPTEHDGLKTDVAAIQGGNIQGRWNSNAQ